MALKILLADDSMTAQNMGKKILTEAGYEVVAVSNGAQAVKKIASEKPDMAVLDVFMPGYTGVEVCERVKKAQETAHMPVLLTVGKMEPFKPEEGTRAGADGLVVKPFEASDLVAAIKKIEEKLAGAAAEAAAAETTAKMPVEEFQDASYEEWKVSAPETPAEEEAPASARVAVPTEMAAAPAFGMDFEEPAAAPPSPADTQPVMPPPAEEKTEAITPPPEVARITAPITPPAPVYEPPSRSTAEMPAHLQAAAGAAAAPALAEEPAVPVPPARHEIEFTSHRVDHAVDQTPAPGFEPTVSQEEINVPVEHAPGLVTDADELSQFATKFGVEGAEPVPVGVAAEVPGLYADNQPPVAEAPAAAESSADADFEARVAAAMAGYEETGTVEAAPAPVPEPPAAVEPPPAPAPEPPAAVAPPLAPEPVIEPEPAPAAKAEAVGEDTAALLAQMQQAVENLPIDTTPHLEATAEPVPPPSPTPEPIVENAPDHALAAAMAAAVGAAVEPQVAAAVAPPSPESTQKIDPTMIADIVHRVVERMKPDLAAEIARELEAKLKK